MRGHGAGQGVVLLLEVLANNTATASGPRLRLRSGGNSPHCSKCSALAWH